MAQKKQSVELLWIRESLRTRWEIMRIRVSLSIDTPYILGEHAFTEDAWDISAFDEVIR